MTVQIKDGTTNSSNVRIHLVGKVIEPHTSQAEIMRVANDPRVYRADHCQPQRGIQSVHVCRVRKSVARLRPELKMSVTLTLRDRIGLDRSHTLIDGG